MNNQISMKDRMNAIARYLTDKKMVLDLLTSHGIVTGGQIESLELYERGEDRRGVIVKVKENGVEGATKIMIDVKWGQPCIDQVYDAIYEIGKDCSKRLIVFNGEKYEKDSGNPAADEEVVWSLIANMNAYPLGLYLVKMNEQFKTELVDLECFVTEQFPNKYPMSDLPSKERFREAEFWEVYYDSFHKAFYRPWEAFCSGIDNTSSYGEWWDINRVSVHVAWDEKGAFFTVREDDSDNDYVKGIWKLKEFDIKHRYPDREVELLILPGKLPMICVGFWDLPLSWLMTASTEEKMARSEVLFSEYRFFMGFMEYALDEVKESLEPKIQAIGLDMNQAALEEKIQ